MSNINLCRICLANDMKMTEISNTPQQEMYEKFTGAKLITEDGRPDTLCYLCNSQLFRFSRFYRMSQQAENYLTGLLRNEPPEKLQGGLHNLSLSIVQKMSLTDPLLMKDTPIKTEPIDSNTNVEEMQDDTDLVKDTITDNKDLMDTKDINADKSEIINGLIINEESDDDELTIVEPEMNEVNREVFVDKIIINRLNADSQEIIIGIDADRENMINVPDNKMNDDIDTKHIVSAIADKSEITNGVFIKIEESDDDELTIVDTEMDEVNREVLADKIIINGLNADNQKIMNGWNADSQNIINVPDNKINDDIDTKNIVPVIADQSEIIKRVITISENELTIAIITEINETNQVATEKIITNCLYADRQEMTNESADSLEINGIDNLTEDRTDRVHSEKDMNYRNTNSEDNNVDSDIIEVIIDNEEYPCDQCEKKFKFAHQLKFHKRLHAIKTKNQTCVKCNKKFIKSSSLALHLLKVHEKRDNKNKNRKNKVFECNRCVLKFKNETELVKHVITHTTPRVVIEKVVITDFDKSSDEFGHSETGVRTSPRLAKCRKI